MPPTFFITPNTSFYSGRLVRRLTDNAILYQGIEPDEMHDLGVAIDLSFGLG